MERLKVVRMEDIRWVGREELLTLNRVASNSICTKHIYAPFGLQITDGIWFAKLFGNSLHGQIYVIEKQIEEVFPPAVGEVLIKVNSGKTMLRFGPFS